MEKVRKSLRTTERERKGGKKAREGGGRRRRRYYVTVGVEDLFPDFRKLYHQHHQFWLFVFMLVTVVFYKHTNASS